MIYRKLGCAALLLTITLHSSIARFPRGYFLEIKAEDGGIVETNTSPSNLPIMRSPRRGDIFNNAKDDDLENEYYTRLRIYPNDLNVTFKNCNKQGKSTGWLFASKIDIDFIDSTNSRRSLVRGMPFLTAANNIEAGSKKLARGCTFLRISDDTGPYIRNVKVKTTSLGETGGYAITVSYAYSQQAAPHALSVASEVITKFALAWTPLISNVALSTSQAGALNTAASAFDRLATTTDVRVEEVVAFLADVDASNNPKPMGRRLLFSPRQIDRKIGDIKIYLLRSASIILDHSGLGSKEQKSQIRPIDILTNPRLGVRHDCGVGIDGCDKIEQMIPKKDNSGPLTFNVTGNLKWTNKSDDDDKERSRKNDEAVKNWSRIIETCNRIRRKTEELSLVSIDALMVRWAILASHGKLIDVLIEADADRVLGGKFGSYVKALSKVETLLNPDPGRSAPQRGRLCWSRDDAKRLGAIAEAANTEFKR